MTEQGSTTWTNDLAANRLWIESEGKEGAVAHWFQEDLSSTDLREAILAEANLVETNFANADLNSADMSNAFAGGAKFHGANIGGANFTKAELSGADFEGAEGRGATFSKAKMIGANLRDASLGSANFEQADVTDGSFLGADLSKAKFWKTVLYGTNLCSADLSFSVFEETLVNNATLLNEARGLDSCIVRSIIAEGIRLSGAEAMSWLKDQSGRKRSSVQDFELWLLSKMSGDCVERALVDLNCDRLQMNTTAAELGMTFDQIGHRASEYIRVLGPPISTSPIRAPSEFAGSVQHIFHLPLWQNLGFAVNEHPKGYAWGVGFSGGETSRPSRLADIRPWRWTLEQLRTLASGIEIEEQWTYDLDAIIAFDTGERFRARFDFNLLQSWRSF